MNLKTTDIRINPENRKYQGEPKVLASVKKEGIIVPLLVVKNGKKYELIDGHNRLHSAIYYGLEEVPVTVITKEQGETFGEVCNIDRQGLTALDEALAIKKLAENGYEVKEISDMLGAPRKRVGRRLKMLNNLHSVAREKLESKKMSLEVAEALCLVSLEAQKQLLDCNYEVSEYAIRKKMGADLSKFGECFKKGCTDCPNNSCTNRDLFDEKDSFCSEPSCLVNHIEDYCKAEGLEGIADYYLPEEMNLPPLSMYTKFDHQSISWDKPHSRYSGQKKYFNWAGRTLYMGGEEVAQQDIRTLKIDAERSAVMDLNDKLFTVYAQMRNCIAYQIGDSVPDGFGCSSYMAEVILCAYCDIADRRLPVAEARFLAKDISGADYRALGTYGDYFKLRWPTLAKIDKSYKKEAFHEAVGELVYLWLYQKELARLCKKVKGFDISQFAIADISWQWSTCLNGHLMDNVRSAIAEVEKWSKEKAVKESDITNASLALLEARRLCTMTLDQYREEIDG